MSEVRAWAKGQGYDLGDRGRLPAEVWAAWESRAARAPQRRQVPSEPRASAASSKDLAAAQERIGRLEQQVAELNARLAAVESRPAETRKLFARTR